MMSQTLQQDQLDQKEQEVQEDQLDLKEYEVQEDKLDQKGQEDQQDLKEQEVQEYQLDQKEQEDQLDQKEHEVQEDRLDQKELEVREDKQEHKEQEIQKEHQDLKEQEVDQQDLKEREVQENQQNQKEQEVQADQQEQQKQQEQQEHKDNQEEQVQQEQKYQEHQAQQKQDENEQKEQQEQHGHQLQHQVSQHNVFYNDQYNSKGFFQKIRENIILFYGILFLGVAGLVEGPFVLADIPIDRIEQWLPDSVESDLAKNYFLYYAMKIAGPFLATVAMCFAISMLVRSWKRRGKKSRWMRWPVLVLTCVAICIGFPVSSVGFVIFSVFGGVLTFYAGHYISDDVCTSKNQQPPETVNSVSTVQPFPSVVLRNDPTTYKQSIPGPSNSRHCDLRP